MNKNTLVVNFLGGPGIGKSTTSAGVFNRLKEKGVNCELTTEYAKELVWQERNKTFNDQIYLFAKQYHRLFNIIDAVDVVINDGALLLTPIYDQEKRTALKDLVFNEYNKMRNLNILLNRKKKFVSVGRIHNEEQSKNVDKDIEDFLINNNIPFIRMNDVDEITKEILNLI